MDRVVQLDRLEDMGNQRVQCVDVLVNWGNGID